MMQNDQRFEKLSAYLDGELPAAEADALRKELSSDPALEREYRLLSATRRTVRDRTTALRTPIPVDLERSIRLALGREVEQASVPDSGWLDRILTWLRTPAFAISAAAVVLAVVVVLTIDRPDATNGVAALRRQPVVNLYTASYDNFSKIRSGDLQLAKASSNADELREFFRNNGVTYDVFFPELAAELRGGVVSEHEGHRYAHLVYGAGEHLVYIFEVDEASVQEQTVAMDRTVAQDLAESRWHWEERSGVGTMFVWESNNVICSAVSDLRTQDLSALFTLEKL